MRNQVPSLEQARVVVVVVGGTLQTSPIEPHDFPWFGSEFEQYPGSACVSTVRVSSKPGQHLRPWVSNQVPSSEQAGVVVVGTRHRIA